MNKQMLLSVVLTGMLFLAVVLVPQTRVQAQDVCRNASGAIITCPPTVPEDNGGGRKTSTPVPPTFTFTPTTASTFTPTATPIFSDLSTNWYPGIGIGAFLLFMIVGLLLPAIPKK